MTPLVATGARAGGTINFADIGVGDPDGDWSRYSKASGYNVRPSKNLLHRRIAFPIRDSGREHQVLALAPSRKDWHSVRKRA